MNIPGLINSVSASILIGTCVLTLSACAPAPKVADSAPSAERRLVYPAPPDEPRFAFERSIFTSADVVPDTEESALRRALTGQGRTGEALSKPYAIATHRGKIYVSDSADRHIKVFDVPNGKYFKVGEKEDGGQLTKPLGVDVDEKTGTIYVADGALKAVLVYDPEGNYQRKIGGPKLFDRLSSVTIDPPGERLYVTDIGGVTSEQHLVRVFNAKTGEHLFDIGRRGTGPGEFNLPRDVAIGKEGRVYVVDGGNFRIQIFDRDGKYIKSFGAVGKQLGNFARPKEIATDRDGNVYVADSAFGNFQIFNPEGELLMFIGDRSESEAPGKYMLPSGITVDEDGRIYFVDQWFRKVDIFRPYKLKPDQGYLGRTPTAQPKTQAAK
jgi:DNA-binding beta-propeller fold protein YncE